MKNAIVPKNANHALRLIDDFSELLDKSKASADMLQSELFVTNEEHNTYFRMSLRDMQLKSAEIEFFVLSQIESLRKYLEDLPPEEPRREVVLNEEEKQDE